MINHAKYKHAASNIQREITIHKTLEHENIIKYYGRRQEPQKEYIFLEYAAGGELFQLIGLRQTNFNNCNLGIRIIITLLTHIYIYFLHG